MSWKTKCDSRHRQGRQAYKEHILLPSRAALQQHSSFSRSTLQSSAFPPACEAAAVLQEMIPASAARFPRCFVALVRAAGTASPAGR